MSAHSFRAWLSSGFRDGRSRLEGHFGRRAEQLFSDGTGILLADRTARDTYLALVQPH
ncbi:hypothetical protein [Streptomyces sp. NPDC058620]|uniref:hypothetical protein n=1 Tax=Streptomyces sp. NPDC058620 TaxID=3346560 RepID=UPI003648D553